MHSDLPFSDFTLIDVPEYDGLKGRIGGKTAAKVLIVYQNTDADEALDAFLEKILAAVQLSVGENTLILRTTENEKLSFIAVQKNLKIQYFISFGVPPGQLGIGLAIANYQPVQRYGVTFLFADDLQKIYEERQQGGKRMSGELWRALKMLFA